MSDPDSTAADPAAVDPGLPVLEGRSYVRFVLVLGALIALGPLTIDMYLPAFPELARDLRTDPASVQRTLAAYFVGLAIGQAFYGPLADRLGRKLPLYAGLAIFSLASAVCALATCWPA